MVEWTPNPRWTLGRPPPSACPVRAGCASLNCFCVSLLRMGHEGGKDARTSIHGWVLFVIRVCAAACGTGSDLTRPSDEFGSRGARTLHHSKRLHIRGGAQGPVLSGSTYHFALDDDGDGSREVLHGDSVGDSAGEDSRFPVTVEVQPWKSIPNVLLLVARVCAPTRYSAGVTVCLSCRRPYRT